jgi:threonine dehydrogenase-like Zn-dependent dehydrogenase
MKAWVTYGFDDLRLEDVADPQPRPGWPLVRINVVQPAITEVQLLKGERTSGYDLVAERLAEGPQLLFGHEFCGEVVQVATENERVAVGDRVTALHSRHGTIGRHFPGCFAELAALPADALVPVADEVDDWSAAALQPLSSCVRIVEDLGIGFSDTVLVLGQGVMGLNCAQTAKAAGARRVIGVDRRPDLLEVARRLGVDETIDASTEDVVARVLELTDGRGSPVVIEAASGSPAVGLSGGATVHEAVACVATGGTVLSLAHHHEPVSLDFNACRRKRLRYQFPPRGAGPEDMLSAMALVASRRVDLGSMITHRLEGIESLPDAIDVTANKAKYGALNPAQVRFA